MGNQPSRPGEKTPSHTPSPSYSHPSRHQHRKHASSASAASRSPAPQPTSGSSAAGSPPAASLHPPFHHNTDPLTLAPHTSSPDSRSSHDSRQTRSHTAGQYHPHTMGQSQSSEGGGGGGSGGRDSRSGKQRQAWDDGSRSSPVQVPAGGVHSQQHSQHQRRAREAAGGPTAEGHYASAAVAGVGEMELRDEYAPKSNLNFPPRLPLPIQEEVYTPGSPIITPDELSQALREDPEDPEGQLPHRTSLLSHTTADDEEEPAESESAAAKGRTVPTVIEWRGVADKVYVTGSFAAWSRKFRMHKDVNDPHLLSTTLDLLPGTHHVKFIIDGDMKLSDELPTAVDYTNILVNYIEVSADDIPRESAAEELSEQNKPADMHPPLVMPPGIEHTDWQSKAQESEKHPSHKKYMPSSTVHYSNVIPQYLPDLDREENTNRFRRGSTQIGEVPPPPTLPMFLGKSILHGTTPMKDDNSVLNMPNHTVLNHLATSSIKNEVLATSLTTRYKRKYITTITYRPTREED